MSEPTQIDLAPFLAAVIEELGGEARVPFDTFRAQTGGKAISIDLEDDGATIVLRTTEEIPVED